MLVKYNAIQQLTKQIDNLFGISEEEIQMIEFVYSKVIERMDNNFSKIKNKYFCRDGESIFNPLHTGQWTMFLYYMARLLWENNEGNHDLCDKIYGCLKCFSSADIYYEVNMPEIWFFDHPQGSVLGRAKYENYFTFSQGCTVGNNKGKYPRFGEHVSMLSNSKVLGECQIGDHVIFSANSYILDKNVPPYSIVFGMHPNNKIVSISHFKFIELTSSMFVDEE